MNFKDIIIIKSQLNFQLLISTYYHFSHLNTGLEDYHAEEYSNQNHHDKLLLPFAQLIVIEGIFRLSQFLQQVDDIFRLLF